MEHKQTFLLLLTVCISPCIYSIPAKKDGVDNGEITRTLAKYFSTYGYTSSYTENVNDIRASIRNFQYFGGLIPTGRLDKPTIELLKMDRCGMKDPIKEKRMKKYVRQGIKWKTKTLTWRYEHNTNYENPRRLGKNKIRSVMKKAMSLWEVQTNIKFVEDIYTNKPDVWMKFTTRRQNDSYSFGGSVGTLAHGDKQNKGFAGDIYFDDDEYFFIEKKMGGYGKYRNYGTSLYWVAVHMLGHTLGLEHSRTQSAIMYPFYRGDRRDFKLDYDDIVGIERIYGAKNRSEKPDNRDKSRPRKPDKGIPLNKRCPAAKVTALFESEDGEDYMLLTENERLYIVDKNGGGIKQADINATSYYRKIRGRIDAVLQLSFGFSFIFSEKNYYWYKGIKYLSGPHPLHKLGLPDHLERIDGAMKWWLNNKIYFFSGEQYWRFKVNPRYNKDMWKLDPGYPKKIEDGWGLPGKVDAALCSYKTKEIIFTIDDQIYHMELRPRPVRVKLGYPRNIKTDLLNCQDV